MSPPDRTARLNASGTSPLASARSPYADKDAHTSRLTAHSPHSTPHTPRSTLLDPLVRFFASLRLTVACLGLGLVLIFLGTMAQDPLGLFLTQETFFHSFFVPASAMAAAIKKAFEMFHVYLTPSTAADVLAGSKLPVFPGGYLLGGTLLLNLLTAHFTRFTFTRKKAGIWMVHAGLILLLLGQLLTDMLARESVLHLREGEAKNYSELSRRSELVVNDTTEADTDKVVAIPQGRLTRGQEIRHPELPFTVRVKEFFGNSSAEERPADSSEPAAATQDIGARAVVKPLPPETDMNKADVPSSVIELVAPQGSLGTWLVSGFISRPQSFSFANRTYQLGLRRQRIYKPFTIRLLKFQHDIYPGTDIPKNFSSRILLQRPDTGEKREVLVYMNSPLRYAGETYYQSSFDPDDHGSVLQVVRNPSWLTPYFSVLLVGLGLVVQFGMHLFAFTAKRKPRPA